jgi:hypothetical protein
MQRKKRSSKNTSSKVFVGRSLSRPRAKFSKLAAAVLSGVFGVLGTLLLVLTQAAPGSLAPHNTYTDWEWAYQRGAVNNSIETSVKIETDTTKVHPGIGYFYLSGFFFNCMGCESPNGSAYMGIQTNGEAGSYRGKVAIFSVFGAAISAEVGSRGSWCKLEGNGFDGYAHSVGSTCRVPLNWQAGEEYTVKTELIAGDSTTYTWQASVRNLSTGQELIIGKIKTPVSWARIQGYLINNTEYYSAGRAECDAPYSKVVFGLPKVNSWYTPSSNRSYYGTYRGCNQSFINTVSGGSIRHEMGNPSITGALPLLPSGGTYISDLSWSSATTGYGVITKDKSVTNDGSPINLAGKTFAKGLGTHAASEIKYALNGGYSRFVGYVNMQYGAGGRISYQVWADGAKLFDSGLMDGLSYTKAVNVDVTGKKELKLVVTDGGDGIAGDWAAWADARLTPSSTAAPEEPQPQPPVSSGDTVTPVVNITSPANNSTVGNGTYVTANASDNKAVTRMEVIIDGVIHATSTSGSVQYTWISYYASAGDHNITVKAYDAAGNVGQSAITVKK